MSSSDDESRRRPRKRKNTSSREDKPAQPLRTLKQYMIEEKLDIINFAKQMGNRAAGREYNVAESSIREWRKNEERLKATLVTEPTRNRLVGGGRKPMDRRIFRPDSDDDEKSRDVIHVPLSLGLMNNEENLDVLDSSGSTSYSGSCQPSATPSPLAVTPVTLPTPSPSTSVGQMMAERSRNNQIQTSPNLPHSSIPHFGASLQIPKLLPPSATPPTLGSSKRKTKRPTKVIVQDDVPDFLLSVS